jgi:hypothetical protein
MFILLMYIIVVAKIEHIILTFYCELHVQLARYDHNVIIEKQ